MINTEEMFDGLEIITGIKPERNESGMLNITKFVNDYKNKFPKEFKARFGNATTDEVIAMFLSENNNNN